MRNRAPERFSPKVHSESGGWDGSPHPVTVTRTPRLLWQPHVSAVLRSGPRSQRDEAAGPGGVGAAGRPTQPPWGPGPDVAPPPGTRGGRGAETLCSRLHGASPVRRNEPASGPSSRRGLRAQPLAHVLTMTPARRQPPLSPALRRGGRVTGACADRPRPQLGVWPGPTASPLLIHASALEKSPHRGALSVPV